MLDHDPRDNVPLTNCIRELLAYEKQMLRGRDFDQALTADDKAFLRSCNIAVGPAPS